MYCKLYFFYIFNIIFGFSIKNYIIRKLFASKYCELKIPIFCTLRVQKYCKDWRYRFLLPAFIFFGHDNPWDGPKPQLLVIFKRSIFSKESLSISYVWQNVLFYYGLQVLVNPSFNDNSN